MLAMSLAAYDPKPTFEDSDEIRLWHSRLIEINRALHFKRYKIGMLTTRTWLYFAVLTVLVIIALPALGDDRADCMDGRS